MSIIDFLNNIDLLKHMMSSELNLLTHRDIISIYIAFWGKFKFQYHELVSIERKKRDYILHILSNHDNYPIIKARDKIKDINFYKYVRFVNLCDKYTCINLCVCKFLADHMSTISCFFDNVIIPTKSSIMSEIKYIELHRRKLENQYQYDKFLIDTLYDDLRIERGDRNFAKIGAIDRWKEICFKDRRKISLMKRIIETECKLLFHQSIKNKIEKELQSFFKQNNYKDHSCDSCNGKYFTINCKNISNIIYENNNYVCLCPYLKYYHKSTEHRHHMKYHSLCKGIYTKDEIMQNK